MRRLATVAALLAAGVPTGVAAATAPPDTTPPATTAPGGPDTSAPDGTAAPTSAPPPVTSAPAGTTVPTETAPPDGAEPVTVYDDEGNAVATITVLGVETAWTDYAEGDEPDEGNEYVRVTVTVASQAADDETFGVAIDDFILQSNNGFVTTAENVRTAAQAEADEDVIGEADLAADEAVDLTLTFQVVADAGPQSVFYRPDEERLVDVAEIE